MKSWHFVGICGIGMSALAQFARTAGFAVSGSDRALENPENAPLKAMLEKQGIKLFGQDGSRFAAGNDPADAVVYSTAVEESNPDFAASQGVARLHRATALKMLIQMRCSGGKLSVAVAGSCGKTSTTAIISEALYNAGKDPECINGGMVKKFVTATCPGNYRSGAGAIVFEADESDKSLLEFHPDYALVLNIGTDHYPKAELIEMFAQFVNQSQRGAVLEQSVFEQLKDKLRPGLEIKTFSAENVQSDWVIKNYRTENRCSMADFNSTADVQLPAPGLHTALNIAAAAALLELMQCSASEALAHALNTHGVARRFDFKGRTAAGAEVYDDYAHNPEKIANILAAAQELAGSGNKVLAFFQPHGYGPFGFMQKTLGEYLNKLLRKNDRFYLAEPFYAGGTSSFSPHAEEVFAEWKKLYPALPVYLAGARAELKTKLQSQAASGDIILVMGARDNTLAEYAAELGG